MTAAVSPKLTPRQWLLLSVLALAVIVPLALLGSWVYGKHLWAQEQLATMEPRYARLVGMQAQSDDIQKALEDIATVKAQHVYPGEQDSTQTGNAIQQRLRALLDKAGLSVVSSQVRPASESEDQGQVQGPYERISVSMTAEGNWPAIQLALLSFREVSPTVWLDDLQLNLLGSLEGNNPRAAPKLSAQFTFSILRSKP
ncbi:MAG: type II secretion system protein M [Burkholderiaceae bacterium]|jgi:general secretion pathway protein M|nr:type II secretion system protein M [Burkholderiaceae bacterium]